MSIFNPWAEARQLRAELHLVRNALVIERSVVVSLREKLANAHMRDPQTGRILPKGK
jgi:hypothetical protein